MSYDSRQWLNSNYSRLCKRCGGADRCSVHKIGHIHLCRNPEANEDAEAQKRKRESSNDGSIYWVWYETEFLDPSIPKPIWLTQDLPLPLEQPYLHQIYSELLGYCSLSAGHVDALLKRYGWRQESGQEERQALIQHFDTLVYRTIPREQREQIVQGLAVRWGVERLLRVPGIVNKGGILTLNFPNTSGIIIPVRDEAGQIVALKMRLDNPSRPGERYLSFSSANYGGPKCNATVHHPLNIQKNLHLQKVRIVEGELKADISLYLSGVPTISIPGVSSWAKAFPSLDALYGKWGQRIKDVVVAFDSDARYKPRVASSLECLCEEIIQLSDQYFLSVEIWNEHDGKGIDDVLAAGALTETKKDAEAIEILQQITRSAGIGALEEQYEGIVDQVKQGNAEIFAQEETIRVLSRVTETAILRLYQAGRDYLQSRFPQQQIQRAIAEERKNRLIRNGTDEIDPTELGVPIIEVYNKRVCDVGFIAQEAIERMNDPPRLFRFGDGIAKLKPGGKGMEPLYKHTLNPELERSAMWVKTTKAGQRTTVPCPGWLTDYMINSVEIFDRIPKVEGIVHWPCVIPDTYRILQNPGYDYQTYHIYLPKWHTQLPDINPYPTQDEINESLNAFRYILQDFPFADQASFANALGLIFTHTLFLDIKEKPLFVVEAPTIGSGKGKLLDVLTIPFTREQVARSPYAQDRDEVRKRLLSLLLPLPTHVLFDNVAYTMDSDALALALTTSSYSDRELGKTLSKEIPVRCIWAATGNNIQASPEINRRMVRIRIDTNEEKPYLRTGFAIERDTGLNLDVWLRTQGWVLQYHALRLTNAWIAAGCPKWTERSFGSYPTWAEKVGGILQVIGVPGFLGNLDQSTGIASGDESFMQALVLEAMPLLGQERPFTAAGSYNALAGFPALMAQLAGRDEDARKTSLGRRLAGCAGKVFGDYKLVRIDSSGHPQYMFIRKG